MENPIESKPKTPLTAREWMTKLTILYQTSKNDLEFYNRGCNISNVLEMADAFGIDAENREITKFLMENLELFKEEKLTYQGAIPISEKDIVTADRFLVAQLWLEFEDGDQDEETSDEEVESLEKFNIPLNSPKYVNLSELPYPLTIQSYEDFRVIILKLNKHK